MSILSELAKETKDLEQSKDVLAGGGFTRESDIYEAVIKAAYLTTFKSGAQGLGLILKLNDDKPDYTETLVITNKEGKPYFLSKQNNKKTPLPGYSNADDLCWLLTEKALTAQETENKELKLWDSDARAEIPQSVPCLTDLMGKKVYVAIRKIRENKQAYENGVYVKTKEEVFRNRIEKFFHSEYKCTYPEARDKKEVVFFDEWLKKNQGKVRDQYDSSASASTGSAVEPRAKKPGTSLFGK